MTTSLFDSRAKDWVKNPDNITRAQILSDEIKNNIKLNDSMTAYEFGCGTGLLSYLLKDEFAKITLADSSEGMIDVIKERINTENILNFEISLMDVDTSTELTAKNSIDIIYTSMALHHVLDIDAILKKFNHILKIDGYLCIADLSTEDGRFHSHMPHFVGHSGFDKDALTMQLNSNNFNVELYKTVLDIDRHFPDGASKSYPVFLLIAKKNK